MRPEAAGEGLLLLGPQLARDSRNRAVPLRPTDPLTAPGICTVGLGLLGGVTAGSLEAVLSYLFFFQIAAFDSILFFFFFSLGRKSFH